MATHKDTEVLMELISKDPFVRETARKYPAPSELEGLFSYLFKKQHRTPTLQNYIERIDDLENVDWHYLSAQVQMRRA